tara:strand:- start:985 stop:1350 length:366 start_codon:yes stop_codon:yes gene_type:complete
MLGQISEHVALVCNSPSPVPHNANNGLSTQTRQNTQNDKTGGRIHSKAALPSTAIETGLELEIVTARQPEFRPAGKLGLEQLGSSPSFSWTLPTSSVPLPCENRTTSDCMASRLGYRAARH